MAGRVFGVTTAVGASIWLVMAGFALGVLRLQGLWPRTPLGWVLILGPGPVLSLLPYALLDVGMLRLGRFAAARWGEPRPGERFRAKRAALLLGAVGVACLAFLGLVWVLLALPAFRQLGMAIGRQFQVVR